MLLIPVFLVVLALLILFWNVPRQVAGVYLLFSLLSLFVYWRDKRAAERAGRRTPEKTLHILALIGGWPGALLAQQLLRHKSLKAEFRSAFWATVLLNVTALVWLASPPGRAVLSRLIGA